jgi:hypothetical protein
MPPPTFDANTNISCQYQYLMAIPIFQIPDSGDVPRVFGKNEGDEEEEVDVGDVKSDLMRC